MKKINIYILFFIFSISNLFADNYKEFSKWKINFKDLALSNNISEKNF